MSKFPRNPGHQKQKCEEMADHILVTEHMQVKLHRQCAPWSHVDEAMHVHDYKSGGNAWSHVKLPTVAKKKNGCAFLLGASVSEQKVDQKKISCSLELLL